MLDVVVLIYVDKLADNTLMLMTDDLYIKLVGVSTSDVYLNKVAQIHRLPINLLQQKYDLFCVFNCNGNAGP